MVREKESGKVIFTATICRKGGGERRQMSGMREEVGDLWDRSGLDAEGLVEVGVRVRDGDEQESVGGGG
jgi:hypothetical protein